MTPSPLPWFLGGFPGKQGVPTYKSRRCAKVLRSVMRKIRQTASEGVQMHQRSWFCETFIHCEAAEGRVMGPSPEHPDSRLTNCKVGMRTHPGRPLSLHFCPSSRRVQQIRSCFQRHPRAIMVFTHRTFQSTEGLAGWKSVVEI